MLDRRPVRAWTALLCVAAAVACGQAESGPAPTPTPPAAETAWVEIGNGLFELELALDPATRYLGLGRRRSIAEDGGMLFVFPDSRPMAFVMRDCPVPIDVAFLDASGTIVAIHEMSPEPPRAPGESNAAYERRLTLYPSGAPALFAVETAGGRLVQVGARVGDRAVFDAEGLARRAR